MRVKKIIKKILFPPIIVGFFFFNLGFGLLIYVFTNHLEDTPIAYISYLLSSYALSIFCVWFYKACKWGNKTVKKSKLYSLYRRNSSTIVKKSLFWTGMLNLLYGLFKLSVGIYYVSWWYITFAVYYLLLCFIKFILNGNEDRIFYKLRHTGVVLLILNLILMGIVILIIKKGHSVSYDGYLIYLVALYDFYLIINAIVKIAKHRKSHNPIILAHKCLNLTVAMISMLSLEVAMINQFGNNDDIFKHTMIICTSGAICLINSVMAIYMILKAQKSIKKNDGTA